ncbi:hypothetical protein [Herbaspirillum rubrisubalbicans]|uniref:hypothetical protein n=1 Tax=Herbaspirillum rubrisubalbicans TaxID=80842 RepID=UPI0002DB5546|nr:hypothetical protein [Herbaspirillum rubrisubalbicans]
MFGKSGAARDFLFSKYELRGTLQARAQKMREEVESLDANQFLNMSAEDLKNYLVEKFSVAPLKLLREHWYQETSEVNVDVSHDSRRFFMNERSGPVYVKGERVEVHIPFEGEADLLYQRGDTFNFNPPQASVQGHELVLSYDFPADSPLEIRPLVEQTLASIEEHLKWQNNLLDSHNRSLNQLAAEVIQQRRARLLAQSARADASGIPVKRRVDAPKTYEVPTVRKKAAPVLPVATTAQYKPEPTWAMEQYEQALKIMQDMTLVMERSPEAFRTMDEEAIRQHFLVQLNGQFEGKATGETFNMGGKTDILLREGDRNVFIAECKFWKGPKKFSEAIDQLLGYSTWRDGKSAILVFNRGTDTSTVLDGVRKAIVAHGNFKREITWPHDSGFRFVLHNNEDKNREIIVTVLVFHIPE